MRTALRALAASTTIAVAGVQLAAAQGQQPPKPGPEHQRLAYFVGKWKAEGEMKPGPWDPVAR